MKTFFSHNNWCIRTVSFLIMCLLQFSCTERSTKGYNDDLIVDLAKHTESAILASEIFSAMKIINLETSDLALFAGIRELELHDDYIIALDINRGFLGFFNKEGNYKKRLFAQGRGPGEYLAIDDFLIDSEESTIEILDANARRIHIYDLETFGYKKSIPYSINFVYSFTKAGGYYYFQTNGSTNNINGNYTKSEIIAFNYKNEKYYPVFDKKGELTNEPHYSYEFSKIFYKNQEGVVFASLSWDNKFYKLAGTSANPYITLDLGRRAFPREILQGTFDEKIAYVRSPLSEGKLGFFKLIYQDQDSFLFSCRRSFETEESYFFSFNGDAQFANTIINDFAPFGQQELILQKEVQGYFLSIVYPHLAEEDLLKELSVTETDNPIILLFEFKE